ncbi:MAG: DUF4349 domain-containing protein [Myxococcales bacterium]|nr:DUF4349 domain-containing protein [Myxococcales bacterium]
MQNHRRLVASLVLSILLATAVSACKKDGSFGGAPSAAAAPAEPSSGVDVAKLNRKLIRNAELSVTVASPSLAQSEALKIAAANGGYLAQSEVRGQHGDDGEEPAEVEVVLRVASDKLDAALDALGRLGKRVGSEKITSRDVTEEWIDVDARIRTQKKLEEQYLEILKGASKVDDLLSVQKQLAEVRGELEKLEGKKRLLDNQIELSTITVTFHGERPLVAISSGAFGRAAKQAGADAVNVGAAIVTGGIRLFGVLLPVALLIFLPLLLLGRVIVRRFVGQKPAHA